MLDSRFEDEDPEAENYSGQRLFDDDSEESDGEGWEATAAGRTPMRLRSPVAFQERAAAIYNQYRTLYPRRFKWIRSGLFQPKLAKDLQADAENLLLILVTIQAERQSPRHFTHNNGAIVTYRLAPKESAGDFSAEAEQLLILQEIGDWDASQDAQVDALADLILNRHRGEKILIFSQFADTVHYLRTQLAQRNVSRLAAATGNSADPTALAWCFSPTSNGRREHCIFALKIPPSF